LNIQFSQYRVLIQSLENLLREALLLFEDDPRWQGKTGGCFCLADGKTGAPLFPPAPIGEVPAEKAEKYLAFCQEKALRLAAHPDHLASWQSRNPDADQWGGAVRVGDLIFSISGLPEMGDEALMLIMGELHDQHDSGAVFDPTLRQIASLTENPYWDRLREFLARPL